MIYIKKKLIGPSVVCTSVVIFKMDKKVTGKQTNKMGFRVVAQNLIKTYKICFLPAFAPLLTFSLFISSLFRQTYPNNDKKRFGERKEVGVFSFVTEDLLEVEEKCIEVLMELNTPNKNQIPATNPLSQFEVCFL
jgi:hypothetical protein